MSDAKRETEGHERSWDEFPAIRASSVMVNPGDAPVWRNESPRVRATRRYVVLFDLFKERGLSNIATSARLPTHPNHPLDATWHRLGWEASGTVQPQPPTPPGVPAPTRALDVRVDEPPLQDRVATLERELSELRGQLIALAPPTQEAVEPDDTILWAGDWVEHLRKEYLGKWVALRREGLIVAADKLAPVMDEVRRPEYADVRVFIARIRE